MIHSLPLSEYTFTPTLVQRVFEEGLFRKGPDQNSVPAPLDVNKLRYELTASSVLICYGPARQHQRAITICNAYLEQIKNPEQHWTGIDDLFSGLLLCNFRASSCEQDKKSVINKACHLLSRLPATPVLSDAFAAEIDYRNISSSYFLAGHYQASQSDELPRAWETLQVVARVSTNTLRIAIFAFLEEYAGHATVGLFVDLLATLLDVIPEQMSKSQDATERQAWLLLHAFLWATWQRTVTILFWMNMNIQTQNGYSYATHQEILDRKKPSSLKIRPQDNIQNLPQYMCPWAFELLRSDRSCLTQDFRRLHDRFSAAFGSLPARCMKHKQEGHTTFTPCDGIGPENCQRFKGMKITDQSAHDESCRADACNTLVWDEESYRSLSGGRAVCLEHTTDTAIKYRAASKETLAISHVWSHGQGGRPEIGFNSCLHRRYAAISRILGCNSYWMDTPCIPEDHELRAESIANINPTFADSKATLICDRDFADIDISSPTLLLRETILAILLVSDWNVRAWTLLEAMRGRRNIYILCKHNDVVSLRESLAAVLRDGSVDLVALFLATQHLLPYSGQDLPGIDDPPDETETNQGVIERKRYIRGYIEVEEAACLLSHRHASRPGDEVVIWSLLNGNKASYSPVQFWKSRVGQKVSTGFLMSSAPRIRGHRGLGWAPHRPDISNTELISGAEERQQLKARRKHFAGDGRGTVGQLIQEDGLRAYWLICKFRRSKIGPFPRIPKGKNLIRHLRKKDKKENAPSDAESELNFGKRKISEVAGVKVISGVFDELPAPLRGVPESSFIPGRSYPLIQPYFEVGEDRFKYIGLLHPLEGSTGYSLPPTPAEYRGRADGPLFALVGSRDGEAWEWIEVIEWTQEWGEVPVMEVETVLLV